MIKKLLTFGIILLAVCGYAQCPPIEAGNDGTICNGESFQLQASGASGYIWTPSTGLSATNISNPVATPTITTTYYCSTGSKGENLIINGDFENTPPIPVCTDNLYTWNCTTYPWPGPAIMGFDTEYPLHTGYAWKDYFWVNNNCLWAGNQNKDHTTGTGKYLIVDGATIPDVAAWKQTVAVEPNTDYVFSAWTSTQTNSWNSMVDPANIHFLFNGVDIGNVTPLFTGYWNCGDWYNFTTTWNSGSNTSATIRIVDFCYAFASNDFGLDDISLYPLCVAKDSLIITVNPNPAVGISASVNPICAGNSTTLTGSGATSYSWSNGLGTANPVIAKPDFTTTYSVTGTKAGCTGTATITLAVTPNPTVSISALVNPICAGASTILTASGAASYIWSNGLGTANPLTVTPSAMTTYSVTGTETGCTGTASFIVNVNPLPNIMVNPNPATICSGDSVALTASQANTYSWSPATGLDTIAGAVVIAKPASTTAYTITGTLNGCNNTLKFSVNVNPKPNVAASTNYDKICPGDTAEISASGALTFIWTSLPDDNSLKGQETKTKPIVFPLISTKYSVIGTDINKCINSDTVTVIIKPKPALPLLSFNNPVCDGDTLKLFSSSTDSATYKWEGPNDFASNLQNPFIQNASIKDGGKYYVWSFINGCQSDKADIDVVIFKNPENFLPNDTVVCIANFKLNLKNSYSAYMWQDKSEKPYYDVVKAGIYWVKVIDEHNCLATDSIKVKVACPPELYVPTAFSPNDDTKNDMFMVYGKDITKFNLKIFNRWGTLVYETGDINSQWDGKYKGSIVPQGVYTVIIKYKGIYDINIVEKTQFSTLTILK